MPFFHQCMLTGGLENHDDPALIAQKEIASLRKFLLVQALWCMRDTK